MARSAFSLLALALIAGCAVHQAAAARGLQQATPATIAAAAQATPQLSTLLAAVQASSLLDAATNTSTAVTVFAPTNAAFNSTLTALNLTAAQLLADQTLLDSLLSYHIVPVVAPSTALNATQTVPTLLGADNTLTINKTGSTVMVYAAESNATVVTPDVRAGQSIIHIIDNVLLPSMPTGTAGNSTATNGTAGTMSPVPGTGATAGESADASEDNTAPAPDQSSASALKAAGAAVAMLAAVVLM